MQSSTCFHGNTAITWYQVFYSKNIFLWLLYLISHRDIFMLLISFSCGKRLYTRRMIQQCDLLIRSSQNILDVNCMGDRTICRCSGVDTPKKNCSFSMWIHANFLIPIYMAIAIVFHFILNKSEISIIYLLIIMTRFKPNSNKSRSSLADLQ